MTASDAGLYWRSWAEQAAGADHRAWRLKDRDDPSPASVAYFRILSEVMMAYLVVAVVVGYATLSLVNTLILATAERRREFLLQRLMFWDR